MKNIVNRNICLFLVLATSTMGHAGELPEIEGVFGLNRVTSQTYLAVGVPVEEGAVVAGVRWYQNDGTVEFPEISAQAGLLAWPGNVNEAVILAEGVSGQTSAWSEVVFSQPITADSAGLYLCFRVQEGAVFSHEGAGGGFGVGHYAGNGVRSCWLTGNGEDWNPMGANYRMAVEPILVSDKSVNEVLVLKLAGGSEEEKLEDRVILTASLSAYPNPFNPQTKIEFVVPNTGFVKLDVYDLRGHLVRELVACKMDAGKHSVTWNGSSSSGKPASSGVYFARYANGESVLSKQLVLLK